MTELLPDEFRVTEGAAEAVRSGAGGAEDARPAPAREMKGAT